MTRHGWRSTFNWLVPSLVVVVAMTGVFVLLRSGRDTPVPECVAVPGGYAPGVVVGLQSTLETIPGQGGALVGVQLDDGRRVSAHNPSRLSVAAGQRVLVSELRCVHRTLHMLTEFEAPAAPERNARDQNAR